MNRPELVARFDLSPTGEIQAIVRPKHRHYRLLLSVRGTSDDTYAVTYQLHESYRDPVRESVDRTNDFQLAFTSYGDFVVQAKVRSKSGTVTLARSLSAALTDGHEGSMSGPLKAAFEEFARS
jgi:hypothetical protein